jgi:hypothetical protein
MMSRVNAVRQSEYGTLANIQAYTLKRSDLATRPPSTKRFGEIYASRSQECEKNLFIKGAAVLFLHTSNCHKICGRMSF